jgi:hypothetical protein
LDLTGRSAGLVESGGESAAIEVIDGVVLAAGVEEARGEIVGVVKDVEELGSELDAENV